MENIQKNVLKKPFKGPLLLCVLDGFGLREETQGNAVKLAKTPFLDKLFAQNPLSQLVTYGPAVGLPEGQMGNSEVGHMTIGSGRVILQSLEHIRQELSGDLQHNLNWQQALEKAKKAQKIHLIGLVSDGGVHSHTDHIVLLCEKLSVLGKPILVHAILDGRDTGPKEGQQQLQKFVEKIQHLDVHMVDVVGRFYAMDRDNNGDRLQQAYDLYTKGQGVKVQGFETALEQQYQQGNGDEFIEPICLPTPIADSKITSDDIVFLSNFRADRMREITRAFLGLDIPKFVGEKGLHPTVVCMTEYDKTFNNQVITLFPPTAPKNTLGEVVTKAGGKQLRIAESEKYAHVTFFLNGGREEPFDREERIVIPSPKVKSYDLAPKMSLAEVTENLLDTIENGGFDLIVLNIANGDQVGHSGSLEASIEAVEFIDECMVKILNSLEKVEGEMIVIADHGNCEEMLTNQGDVCTSHTLNPVPFLYVGQGHFIAKNGSLADVAPTVLRRLGLPVPSEMTGQNLLEEKG